MLDRNKVRFDKGEIVVIRVIEHSYYSGVVNARSQDSQQIGEEKWLLLQIEAQSLYEVTVSSGETSVTVECTL